MQTIKISDFRANLLNYLKKAELGEKISVSSNGKILATICPPINQKNTARLKLNQIAESAVVYDVTSPTDSPWGAME
jgi:prevent-host-death family protein